MKKHLLFLGFLFLFLVSFAGKFVFIPVSETNNLETLFNHNDLKIHYYCDDYVLATTDNLDFEKMVVLDENAFGDVGYYAWAYCVEANRNEYLNKIATSAKVLYLGDNFLIMKILSDKFIPSKNEGIRAIMNDEVEKPRLTYDYPVITEIDPIIQSLTERINTDTLIAYVEHLQNYGTRTYDEPQAYQAQNWLYSKFVSWGLNTEIQIDIPIIPYTYWGWTYYPHLNSSGNIIAVQPGKVYPDKYIVCGAHYDSFSWDPISYTIAPGADDNATGTAGILEIARVLSQYEFECTIIYCCFAAEEFGLWGSKAYANRCSQQEMNILGYFNIDMSGYLKPGANKVTISIIRPSMAVPLDTYYTNVANTYFPEVTITHHTSMYGDSDHSSFCDKGYQGIYPFENNSNYSPYIHSPQDVIGTSVNNFEQVSIFTKVSLACITTLAVLSGETPPPLPPPTDCNAEIVEGMCIKVTWEAPEEGTPNGYGVYRDGVKIAQTEELFYLDTVPDYGKYCYKVKAIYADGESVFSNESCEEIVPVTHTYYPPTHCVAEYLEEMNIKVSWEMPEEGTPDEYFVYRDSVKIAESIEMFYIDTVSDFLLHCYQVTAIYDSNESEFSNSSCTKVPVKIIEYGSKIKIYPNPTTGELRIENNKGINPLVNVEIYDVFGRKVGDKFSSVIPNAVRNPEQYGSQADGVVINISHLPAGVYIVKISNEVVGKFIKE